MYSEFKYKTAYEAPVCEAVGISYDGLTCSSPSGRIDDFDESDFNW